MPEKALRFMFRKVLSVDRLVEHEPRLDQKIWDFVEEKQSWPIDARSIEHIAKMPEVDSKYFFNRFPDLKYSRIYLGWPDHNDEFILWNNGKIGVSSRSVGGDPEEFPDVPWQPRARGFTFQFGVGDAPRFREYGDSSITQSLLDGFQLVVATDWEEIGLSVHQTNFAYPLQGETIKTGVEPLLAWTELQLENSKDREVSTYLGIEFTNEDFFFHGRKTARMPLPDIEALTWREGGFYLLGELVLVSDPSLKFEEIPTTQGRKRFVCSSTWERWRPDDFISPDCIDRVPRPFGIQLRDWATGPRTTAPFDSGMNWRNAGQLSRCLTPCSTTSIARSFRV